jgi:hypothetical protein
MRVLFKISILFGLLSSPLFAEINEYKSDLYYANGIMMNVSEENATIIWNDKIEELFKNKQESLNKLEKIQNSYNRSQGFFDDLFESLEQKISNEFGWKELSAFVTVFLTSHNIQEDWRAHIDDLSKQVQSYKQSIKDGHGVIVIAHSQGNYYTNEAYAELDEWMKEYFHMFGVATPANHVAGFEAGDTTAPYVKFHSDFIGLVTGGLASNREDAHHAGFPNIPAHDFYASYLSDDTTREDIVSFIETKIQEQVEAQSQWTTDEEFDENTKEYRIKVKHMYDTDIVMDEEVYPFAANKKLYQVQDPLYPDDKEKKVYVKASFGGEEILDDWDGQDKEIQFYKLKGTTPAEYIKGKKTCKDPSLFEIVSHKNKYTENWRVIVKNKETNETQAGVYPFNLNGSLYKLDNSDEWVLASCGGTDILSVWDGQKENEFYKLNGTNPIEYIKLKEMNKFVGYIGLNVGISTWNVKTYRGIYPPNGAFYTKPYAVISHIEKEFYSLYNSSSLSTLVLNNDDSTQNECIASAKSFYEELVNFFDNKILTISGISYKMKYVKGGHYELCKIKRRQKDPSPLYIYAEFRISK